MSEASTATPSLPGSKKAAILLVLLGEEVSGQLLRHLEQEQLAAVARELASLGPIDPRLGEKVLHEYFEDAVRSGGAHGGPEVARRILAKASVPEAHVEALLAHSLPSGSRLPPPLLEAHPLALARALTEEHPQTVALVLLHMPPERASKVLEGLPDSARTETVLRMATLRQVPSDLLGDVVASLQDRIDTALPVEDVMGVKTPIEKTAQLLSNLKRSEIRRILAQLEGEHPDQAAALRGMVFTFDSLMLANDKGIQELLRNIESKKVAVALLGAGEGIANKVFGNLSERAATMLKDEMEFLGTVRGDEQAAARREIIDIALRLEAEEKLVFEGTEAQTP